MEGGTIQLYSPDQYAYRWEFDSWNGDLRFFSRDLGTSEFKAFYCLPKNGEGGTLATQKYADTKSEESCMTYSMFQTYEEHSSDSFNDLMNIDVNNKFGWANRNVGVYHQAGKPINGSPLPSSEDFLVYRKVHYHNENCILVELLVAYPNAGERWVARYDKRVGWVQTWKKV